MSSWTVELTGEATEDIAALDAATRRRVLAKIAWFAEHVDDVTPVPLEGEWREFCKLRVGDWRIAYTFSQSKRTVTVHTVGRRDKIYKQRPPH
ncbi:hypothetical protein A3D11_01655 [Candidatus Peribacteria bacterium RIFCSPHIGHO2_02_FULL_49_16]|nr:MAG: hypothetical protein A3D11_01655 [Candidatus Peribacteria bacterium RIFCSPHIGHO2_02_FULL_49_16]